MNGEKEYYCGMESYKFHLSFKGQLVENSVDAFDVANTILATSYALQEVASIKLGEEVSRNLHLNINAFKEGSLKSQFLYYLGTAVTTAPLLASVAGDVISASKTVLDGFEMFSRVRKALKGKPPESVKALGDGTVQINIADAHAPIIINMSDFRLLQSETMAKNVAKATQPLRDKESLLDELSLIGETHKDFNVSINKEEAPYFEPATTFQTLPEVRYRGEVTKLDSKVRSGYMSIGSRRIPFTYPTTLSQEKYIILAESLKQHLQIVLIGEVTMDYESNPKSILVSDVESEISLF